MTWATFGQFVAVITAVPVVAMLTLTVMFRISEGDWLDVFSENGVNWAVVVSFPCACVSALAILMWELIR